MEYFFLAKCLSKRPKPETQINFNYVRGSDAEFSEDRSRFELYVICQVVPYHIMFTQFKARLIHLSNKFKHETYTSKLIRNEIKGCFRTYKQFFVIQIIIVFSRNNIEYYMIRRFLTFIYKHVLRRRQMRDVVLAL